MTSPFSLTTEEQKMLEKDYKKPKSCKKLGISSKNSPKQRSDLHGKGTIASRGKTRMSEDIAEFLCGEDKDESEKDEDILRRTSENVPLSTIINSTRKMFLLQYGLNVKVGEKTRLDSTLTAEESRLRREEAELKHSEQCFDLFLQENDRKAMEAQRRSDHESRITEEKDQEIKSVQDKITQLKGDIYNLKDSFRKYSLYGKFLSEISPEEWNHEQEILSGRSRKSVPSHLKNILSLESNEFIEGDNLLYFKDPEHLLHLFKSLEEENLSLIQQCQEAETLLETEHKESVRIRDELNQQAENLQGEIKELQVRVRKEKKDTALIDGKIDNSVSGESRRGGEDRMLDDLEKQVLNIYESCVGKNEAKISTIDMLHHIELRMEDLTREQETLNFEKVEIARLSCENERRYREKEARMEAQRRMEESRNKAALDRALAPPYRPKGRRPMFRSKMPGLNKAEKKK